MLSEILTGKLQTPYLDEGRPINNPPYIAPVEGGYEEIVQHLQDGPPHKSYVLGYGGLLNLELLTAGKFQGAILADINQGQIEFWNHTISRIKQCPAKDDFIRSLDSSENDSEIKAYARNCPEKSWLKDKDSYNLVRSAVLAGDVVAMPLSIFDTERHQELKDKNITIGCINITNIMGTINQNSNKGFWSEGIPSNSQRVALQNIRLIAEPSTSILDSSRLMPISSLKGVKSLKETCSVFQPASEYLKNISIELRSGAAAR